MSGTPAPVSSSLESHTMAFKAIFSRIPAVTLHVARFRGRIYFMITRNGRFRIKRATCKHERSTARPRRRASNTPQPLRRGWAALKQPALRGFIAGSARSAPRAARSVRDGLRPATCGNAVHAPTIGTGSTPLCPALKLQGRPACRRRPRMRVVLSQLLAARKCRTTWESSLSWLRNEAQHRPAGHRQGMAFAGVEASGASHRRRRGASVRRLRRSET